MCKIKYDNMTIHQFLVTMMNSDGVIEQLVNTWDTDSAINIASHIRNNYRVIDVKEVI